jgi:GNAT superfamily N-acetyltransferase
MAARIRLRADRDLEECARLLETVHCADGYPAHWPEDPVRWLSPRVMLDAWVAEDAGRIVGHIAFRAGTADASAAVWSDATGLPPEKLASITRLFVSRDSRGNGGGTRTARCGLRRSSWAWVAPGPRCSRDKPRRHSALRAARLAAHSERTLGCF